MKRDIITVGCLIAGLAAVFTTKMILREPIMNESKTNSFVTTPSGLRYKVLQEPAADAAQPLPLDLVSVHYTGWLDNNGERGQKFDSSVDRGQQFQFTVGAGQVISGWDEALLDMRQGEKRLIILAPNLAYGDRGAGGLIPPNATLQFEVELFAIRRRT